MTGPLIDPGELLPPTLVLIAESERAYRITYRNVGTTLDELIGGAGQLEVFGPVGHRGAFRFTWIGSDTPSSGEGLLPNEAPDDLTIEARMAVDVYWEWHAANDL